MPSPREPLESGVPGLAWELATPRARRLLTRPHIRNIAKTLVIKATTSPMDSPMIAPLLLAKSFSAGEVGASD